MQTYYDNELKGANLALHFRSFENWDGVQMLVANMPDDEADGEWKVHTLKEMRLNDTNQHLVKYWSQDIINSQGWSMRQRAYAEHFILAPQYCFNSDTPPKHFYTEMQTADWWWETQVRRDTRG
jgi:hypothetical protein